MARDMIEEALLAPVDEKAIVRSRWIAELRRQGHRQCTIWFRGEGESVCALGLLAEVDGVPLARFTDGFSTWYFGKRVGMTAEQSAEVALRNDGEDGFHKHTFAEIADVVESWFRS